MVNERSVPPILDKFYPSQNGAQLPASYSNPDDAYGLAPSLARRTEAIATAPVAYYWDSTPSEGPMDRRRTAHHAVMAVVGLSFAAAGAISYAWLVPPPRAMVDFEAGRLVAMGELESTLYNPASAQEQGQFAASMEFRAPDGSTCRRFAREDVSGVACLHDGDWRLVSLDQAWPGTPVKPEAGSR